MCEPDLNASSSHYAANKELKELVGLLHLDLSMLGNILKADETKREPAPRSKFSLYFKHLVILNCFWDL